MTLDEMKARKQELGYSYHEIAIRSGLPLSTVQKIFGGITKSPRSATLSKIQAALFDSSNYTPSSTVSMVAEPMPAYGSANHISTTTKQYQRQGSYTLEDYYALPDDQRVELIDGVFYDMTSPSSPHQLIAGSIYAQLFNFRKSKNGKCYPFISPIDVQLDCDDKTMVQPDVIIVCDTSKVIRRCVYGAPDFVVEVLSPSTRKKDMSKKMEKYISAGVREYWMIDPDKQIVVVYYLEELALPQIYSFHDLVPVHIWNKECTIDFSDVIEALEHFSLDKE